MVIWQTEASIEYLRLANAVERDVRQTLDYTRGNCPNGNPCMLTTIQTCTMTPMKDMSAFPISLPWPAESYVMK